MPNPIQGDFVLARFYPMQGCQAMCSVCKECATHECVHISGAHAMQHCGKFFGCYACTSCATCRENYAKWMDTRATHRSLKELIDAYDGMEEKYDRERQEVVYTATVFVKPKTAETQSPTPTSPPLSSGFDPLSTTTK